MSMRTPAGVLLSALLGLALVTPATAAPLQDAGRRGTPRHERVSRDKLHRLVDGIVGGKHADRAVRHAERKAVRAGQRQELGLTDAQHDQLRAVRDQHRGAIEVQRQALHEAHRSLRSLVNQGSADTGAMTAASRRVADALQALSAERAAEHRSEAATLSRDQQATFERQRAERDEARDADRTARKAQRDEHRARKAERRAAGTSPR